MPIYEYQCDGCNEVFEVRQKISDPPPATHSCGSNRLHRVLSATSFVLKGTGWYATDYGNRSQPPAEGTADSKKDKDGAAAPAKDTGGKAEAQSKPSGGDVAGSTAKGAAASAPAAAAKGPGKAPGGGPRAA